MCEHEFKMSTIPVRIIKNGKQIDTRYDVYRKCWKCFSWESDCE